MKKLVFILLFPFILNATEKQFISAGYYMGHTMKLEQIPFKNYDIIYHPFLVADSEGHIVKNKLVPNAELCKLADKHNVPVILSLGGGGYSQFPAIMKSEAATKRLVEGTMKVVLENGYSGLDLDWEHPNSDETGKGWSRLVKIFRQRLDVAEKKSGKKFYLTTALPFGDWCGQYIENEVLKQHIDYLNVMAYDCYGDWGNITGCHSPLHVVEKDPAKYAMTKALEYWVRKGMRKEKILMGLPFYSYKYHESVPYGPRGKVTTYGWSHVQELILKQGWKSQYDSKVGTLWVRSPDGKSFLTADDSRVIRQKSKWAKDNGYAGVFCWAMDHELLPDGSTQLSDAMREISTVKK